MLAKTHIPFAALTTAALMPALGTIVGTEFGPGEIIAGIAVGTIAGMLPDIDHPGALMSKGKIVSNPRMLPKPLQLLLVAAGHIFSIPPRIIGHFVRGVFGHRGGTHSLLFLAAWALLGAPIYAAFFFACAWVLSLVLQFTPLAFAPGDVWSLFIDHFATIMPISIICIALGYFSHLFSDSLNTVPVPWLWPRHKRRKNGSKGKDYVRWFFLPKNFRIRVESTGEENFRIVTFLALGIVVVFNAVLPLYQSTQNNGEVHVKWLGPHIEKTNNPPKKPAAQPTTPADGGEDFR